MNYSKNHSIVRYQKRLNREKMRQRVLFCLSVTFIAGLIVGLIVGMVIRTNASEKAVTEAETEAQQQNEALSDWGSSIFDDFRPLNVSMSEEEQKFVYALCKEYSIDFCLIMAQIQVESSFRSDVVSATGDYGLMQINRMNHEELTEILGTTDYLNPYQNVRAGVYVMQKLFEKYEGETDLVLMAYNMGEYAAMELWKNGVHKSEYSEKILKVQEQYIKELGW